MLAARALSETINHHFQWHKARIDCLSFMLIALFQKRTVNLARLAPGIVSDAGIQSRYRRLQRFFSEVSINYDIVARLCMSMFFSSTDKVFLALDRTNWTWGKSNINILTLAAVYKGQAIPILWLILDKKGNSNTRERIALIKRFIRVFGKERIGGLLADREFIGGEWFTWLKSEGIPIDIRIKNSAIVTNSRGAKVNVKQLFQNLKAGYTLHLSERIIMGTPVYLSALRLDTGELLILAHSGLLKEQNSVAVYGLRWEIETLFGCLKGRGFNFEDTHITKRGRIKKMVAMLAIAFCMAHKTGEWRNDNVKTIPTKTHGRLAQSLFRYGLDWLDDLASQMSVNCLKKLVKSIQYTFVLKEELGHELQ